MHRSRARTLNAITWIFLTLSILVALSIVGLLARVIPLPEGLQRSTWTLPPILSLPTDTRAAPTPSNPIPSQVVGTTRVSPPRPQASKSSPSSTASPSLFPFRLHGVMPRLIANPDPTSGCAFEGIAGQVLDRDNKAVFGLVVNVSSDTGFNQSVITGSNTTFGEAGWLVEVDRRPNRIKYTIELRNPKGVALSQKIQIAFPNSCASNLAMVEFYEDRAL
jgi:hypothetical protein